MECLFGSRSTLVIWGDQTRGDFFPPISARKDVDVDLKHSAETAFYNSQGTYASVPHVKSLGTLFSGRHTLLYYMYVNENLHVYSI